MEYNAEAYKKQFSVAYYQEAPFYGAKGKTLYINSDHAIQEKPFLQTYPECESLRKSICDKFGRNNLKNIAIIKGASRP